MIVGWWVSLSLSALWVVLGTVLLLFLRERKRRREALRRELERQAYGKNLDEGESEQRHSPTLRELEEMFGVEEKKDRD